MNGIDDHVGDETVRRERRGVVHDPFPRGGLDLDGERVGVVERRNRTGGCSRRSDSTFPSGRTGMRFLTQLGTLTVTAYQATAPGGSAAAADNHHNAANLNNDHELPTTTTTPDVDNHNYVDYDHYDHDDHCAVGTRGRRWGRTPSFGPINPGGGPRRMVKGGAGDANTQNAFSVSHNVGLVTNTAGNVVQRGVGAGGGEFRGASRRVRSARSTTATSVMSSALRTATTGTRPISTART